MGGSNPRSQSFRHGAYSLGRLPKGFQYASRVVGALRRALEDAVRKQKGAVSIRDAGRINAACRFETTVLLWQKWLRDEPKLTIEQRLAVTARIEGSTERRDRAIAALGLDTGEVSLWDQLQAARGGNNEPS